MASADALATSQSLLQAVFNIHNEEAWRTFVGRYQPLIVAWCRRHGLQDADADEAAATVLLKLARALPERKYDPKRRFRSWLKTVVDHAVQDLRRSQRRHPAARGSGDSNIQAALHNLAAPGASDELADELDRNLDQERGRAQKLLEQVRAAYADHPLTWQAFEETALKGRPAAEVAAELHTTKAAVYMSKARVLDKVRQALSASTIDGANP